MIDLDTLTEARPHVDPLTESERDAIASQLFATGRASSRRSVSRGGSSDVNRARSLRRSVATVAAAGVVVIAGLVAVQSSQRGPATLPSSNSIPNVTVGTDVPIQNVPDADRALSQGDTGDDVVRLQRRLRDLAFDPGAVNGIFGIETTQAVWAFERLMMGVRADQVTGQVDEQVWATLGAATPVEPRRIDTDSGRHIEVYLPEQVLVVYDGAEPVIVSALTSGELDESGQPAEFCATVRPVPDQAGDGGGSEQSICGTARTPGGAFTVDTELEGTQVGLLGTMIDPIFYNYDLAIYGTTELLSYPSTHGGIAVPLHIADAIQQRIRIGDEVLVWDGLKEPEDHDEQSRLPVFPYPDPAVEDSSPTD